MTSKADIIAQEFRPVLPSEPHLERLFPDFEESSSLLVSCIPADYSASRIARAVEDADAHLLNLNVTSDGRHMDNRLVAELRVSHRSPLSVARSLERYGYEVEDMSVPAGEADRRLMEDRIGELLHYLNL